METTSAGEQPVEKAPGVTPEAPQEKTVKDLLAEKDAEIERIREEKNNYKRGMLIAKGKIKEEEIEEDEDLDAKIDRKVNEKLFDARISEAQKSKEELLNKALKENEEMKRVMRNRGISAPSSMGSNLDKPEVNVTSGFSPEQEADLRARGLDPKEVWKNLPKAGLAGMNSSPKMPE